MQNYKLDKQERHFFYRNGIFREWIQRFQDSKISGFQEKNAATKQLCG
jgi:hypothetical protein